MDGELKIWKAQGSKRIKQGLSAISFELPWSAGCFQKKPEGSLAKRNG
jgi:hypothetical protein